MSAPGRPQALTPEPFKGEGGEASAPGRPQALAPEPFKGEGGEAGAPGRPQALTPEPFRGEGGRASVLHLAKFYPPVHGGMETIVALLARRTRSQGRPCTVLCAHQGRRTVDEVLGDGVHVLRAASLGTVLSMSVAPSLLVHARRLVPAAGIVHVHMPNPLAALALRVAPTAAPVLVHWHSDVVRQRTALRLYEPLQRWLLGRADAIVATSAAYAEASPALRPWLHKVRVVPLGICDTLARERPGRAEALRARLGGGRLVFALGRMAGYKGFDVLIEAAAALPADVRVVIGGAGPLWPALRRRVAEAGLSGRVMLPGPIPEDELIDHMLAADVFCLPSTTRAEAFGVAMLEAMAAARPVVATSIEGSGVPWVNQHDVSGLNVPPSDAPRLARALRELLDDADRARAMGRAGRERYLAEFTAGRMVARTLDLYRSLGGSPAAPTSP